MFVEKKKERKNKLNRLTEKWVRLGHKINKRKKKDTLDYIEHESIYILVEYLACRTTGQMFKVPPTSSNYRQIVRIANSKGRGNKKFESSATNAKWKEKLIIAVTTYYVGRKIIIIKGTTSECRKRTVKLMTKNIDMDISSRTRNIGRTERQIPAVQMSG